MSLPSRERVRRLLAESSRPSTREREALVDSVARESPEIGRELRRFLAALDDTGFPFASARVPRRLCPGLAR